MAITTPNPLSQNVTITGITMAGQQLTAVLVNNVCRLVFDAQKNVLKIFVSRDLPSTRQPGEGDLAYEIDTTSLTPTVTCSISSGKWSWTIS